MQVITYHLSFQTDFKCSVALPVASLQLFLTRNLTTCLAGLLKQLLLFLSVLVFSCLAAIEAASAFISGSISLAADRGPCHWIFSSYPGLLQCHSTGPMPLYRSKACPGTKLAAISSVTDSDTISVWVAGACTGWAILSCPSSNCFYLMFSNLL